MRSRVLLALLSCAVAVAAQAGDVYKMVDSSGRSHFSDQPQPGWSKVSITPVEPTAAPQTEEQARRAEECEKKRADLDKYTRAVYIREKDALGKVHEYSKEERQQLIESTEKEIAGLCPPDQG